MEVPPLRQRPLDVELLADHFLKEFSKQFNKPNTYLTTDAKAKLLSHSWPGNVRELENILQRALTLSENKCIVPSNLDLSQSITTFTSLPISEAPPTQNVTADTAPEFQLGTNFSLEQHLENIEKRAIQQALLESRWNKTAAAQLLGMSFRSLRYRMKKLKLE
jgi:two-component system response regulator PilR (NtrC family)